MRSEPLADDYVRGVRAGDRAWLARAITLVESLAERHRALADEVLERLLPDFGGSHRVGITGTPGVGKSTLIETLGLELLARGKRLAVLAVDPTSSVSGGSILGDKTRMPLLVQDDRAFVRPSPSGGTLGGVTRRTRESLLLCEAAGYDVILVETVGIGQSEARVAELVDTFVVLLLAGAGDRLQGIKRGVLELADVFAITKADGANLVNAEQAANEYRHAFRLLRPRDPAWQPPLLLTSALEGRGVKELWEGVCGHRTARESSGLWEGNRLAQRVGWVHNLLRDRLLETFYEHEAVRDLLLTTEEEVQAGRLTPGRAVDLLLNAFRTPTEDA
jgi:LAO/AO transport system kinase